MFYKLTFVVICTLELCMGGGTTNEKHVQEFLRETELGKTSGNASFSKTLTKARYDNASSTVPKFAPGMVSQACLQCICLKESGCKPVGCIMDKGSYSCGYFQIKEPYWKDCNLPTTDWKTCAEDKICASQCVQNYMKRYAKWAKCPLNCEGFAREHNGGPRGCHNPNTLKYWEDLQKIPHCRNVQ